MELAKNVLSTETPNYRIRIHVLVLSDGSPLLDADVDALAPVYKPNFLLLPYCQLFAFLTRSSGRAKRRRTVCHKTEYQIYISLQITNKDIHMASAQSRKKISSSHFSKYLYSVLYVEIT